MNFATRSNLDFCEALEFPSQAELINFEIDRFKVSRMRSVKRASDLMVVPMPLE
jgi:hypothetical protein